MQDLKKFNSGVGFDPRGGEVKPSIQTAPKAFLDPRISTALLCFLSVILTDGDSLKFKMAISEFELSVSFAYFTTITCSFKSCGIWMISDLDANKMHFKTFCFVFKQS